MIRRREFIAMASVGATAWSLVARSATPKMHHIAIVHPSLPVEKLTDPIANPSFAKLVAELRELGHVEGLNLVIDRYSGEGDIERLPELARHVVRSGPELIVAIGIVMAQPLKDATDAIPIVAITGDPISGGLVASLSHPGRNITGVVIDAGIEVWGKRFELLREVVPTARTVAMPLPAHYWDIPLVQAIRRIAQQAGMLLILAPLHSPVDEPEYRRAFATLLKERVDAVMVADAPEDVTHRRLIVQLIEELRLPAIYSLYHFVEIGGLIVYSPDPLDLMRHVAYQINQILKSAKVGDIPFYQATKFELVINLKTAKALGLTIPPSLLARADEVIE